MGSDVTVHTVVLGAGPGGLAAAYRLAHARRNPVVLEREAFSGGLMRTITRHGFFLDIGRKELYSRNPIVHRFCREILGDQYRTYPRRFASLYRGRIIEQSPAYMGPLRGMPPGMFVRAAADLVLSRIRYSIFKPRTYAEWVYGGSGRLYSQITEQAYWEKIHGQAWSAMPAPGQDGRPRRLRFGGLTEMLSRAHGAAVAATEWRHPARGAGQLCARLEQGITDAGGRFEFECTVTAIASDRDRATSVAARTPAGPLVLRPQHLVSSIPIQTLTALLVPGFRPPQAPAGPPPKRSARLVYLFLRKPPRFPHAWLEVACPDLRAGRITNFAGFNGQMVPPGHGCLCVEYFCTGDDPLLALSDEALRDLALRETASADLVDPAACFDTMVLTLPGADAAINLRGWQASVKAYVDALRPFANVYYINRPSTDQALFAGLLAADAIHSGSRTAFDTTPWG